MARHNSRGNFPQEYAEEFWIGDEFDDEYYDVGQQDDVWSPFEENFKLYVGNVPLEMPQAKIEILFKKFGEPIEIYKSPNKGSSNITWCLITYASYMEALQTIKGLNQKPPYYLIVKFARTEEEKHHLKMKAFAQPYETPYLSGIGRGARFQGYGYDYPYGPQRNRRGDLSLEDDLEPFNDHTPTMLKLVMTPEGRKISIEPRDRRVAVTPSDKPISDFFHTPTKNNLVATSSENDLLGPGIIMALSEGDGSVLGGPCNYCKKITTFVCINCDFPYCSATCQVEHWPEHKKLCFRLGKILKKDVKSRDMGGGDGGFIEHQAESGTNHQTFNTRGDDKHLDGSIPCNTDGYQGRRTFNDETSFSNRKQYRNRHDERNGNFNNDNRDHKEGGFKSDCHSPRQKFDPNDQSDCKIDDDESGRYRNNGFNHDKLKQDLNRNDKEGNRNSHSNDNGKHISEQFFKVSQSGQNFNKDNQSEHRPRGNFSQNRDGNSGEHRKDKLEHRGAQFSRDGPSGQNFNKDNQSENKARHNFKPDKEGHDQNGRDNFARRGEQFSRDGPSGQNFNKDNQSENKARHNFNPDKEGHDQNGRDNFARRGKQFSKGVFSGQNFNSDNQGENRTQQRRYNQGREDGRGGDGRLGRGNFGGLNEKPHNDHNNGSDQDSRPFEKNTGQNKVEEEMWTEERDAAIGQPSVNDKQPTDGITYSNEEKKPKHEFPTTFTDVKIVIVNAAGDYWVQRRDHAKDIVKVYQELIKVIDNNQPIVPKIGMMCAALYENEWYRARVVSDTPQLLLHYIDYGNTEECLLKNIRNLPLSVTNTPDLTTRVRILDGTSTKCLKKPDSILSIRKVGIAPDGVVVVEEKIDVNESLPVSSSCTNQEVQAIVANGYLQSSQEKTIDVTEELQEYFEVIVSEINGPGDYWVQRVQQAKDLIAFQIYLFKKAPECSNLQPEVGLVCLAPFQGGWYRAKVKTLTPLLKIFYVDYGNTLEISHCDLKSLPPMSSLADIPAMAVRVKLVEGTSQNYQNLTVDSKFYIKFIGMTSGDIAYVQMKEADPEIHPKDAQTNVQQEMPPIPVMDEPTEPTVEVPAATTAIKTMQDLPDTFTQVKVSYKNGSTNYWVRLVEQDEIFRRILVELNHAEVNVFIKTPKVGTLVSAYSDGCWCRARVKAVEPHLIVHYIDFGNTEVTTLDILRPLPETLVQDPDLALKIQLADVTSENYHNLEEDAPLNVKPVGKSEDGSIIVQVEGDNYENKNTTQHSQAAHLPNQALQASLSPSQAPQASLPSSQASQASHPPNQAPQASHPPSHSPTASHPPIQTTQASDQQSQAQHASNTSGQLSKPMALSNIIAKDETMLAEPAGNQQSALVDTMQDLPETLTQVKVILTNSSSNYWVQRVDQETALNGILLALFNQTLESLSVKLEIGLMCVGYYENHWYRVRVKTLKPQLTVHFVDYGNTETTTSDQLRQLPHSLSSEPDLAMRIQLAEGTSEQYQNKRENDLLTVKSVGKLKDGSILVHVEGEDYSTKVEKFVSNSSTEDAATSPYKSRELPTYFTEVYVTVANGPCDYWVQTKKCSETARNITLKLNKIVSDCSPVVPKIGLACSALFMGDWYRGLVTSLSPQLKVFYVDYGNTETCSLNDLRTLPENLIDTPSVAIRVQLVDGTPQEYHNLKEGDTISIKRLDIASDGVAFVHVNGGTYTDSQLSPALSVILAEAAEGPATLTDKTEETPGLPGKVVHDSFIKYVVPGVTGALEILKLYSNHFVASIATKDKDCIAQYEMILELTKEGGKLPYFDNSCVPHVGDIVAAMLPSKGSFHRAMVISVEPDGYMVNFCDQGTIKLVSVVKKLPNKYICLPQAAIKCRVLTYLIPEEQFYLEYYKESTSFLFKDVKFLENKKTCILMDLKETPLCEIAMIPWETRPEGNSKGVLSNGDRVMLLQFLTGGLFIVTPAEKNLIEDFKLFSEELNVHCKEVKLGLGKLPEKGDLVACQYLVDMNYYRARVFSIKDKVISVFFVDYGNMDTNITLEMVKPLSEEFKTFPFMAFKFNMAYGSDYKVMPRLVSYIDTLVNNKVPLILEFHPNGVVLKTEDGVSVNEQIKRLSESEPSVKELNLAELEKTFQPPSSDGTLKALSSVNTSSQLTSVVSDVLMISNLPLTTVPVGEKVELHFLGILKSMDIMCCKADKEQLNIIAKMLKELKEFYDSAPQHPHTPVVEELCIAKFGGSDWHRAVCLFNNHNSGKHNLLFLELGCVQEVSSDNIRKMVRNPKVLRIPSLAFMCKLQGVQKTQALITKLKGWFETGVIYSTNIIKHEGSGIYLIDIPDLTAALKAEKLV